jgi:hypothetical protein
MSFTDFFGAGLSTAGAGWQKLRDDAELKRRADEDIALRSRQVKVQENDSGQRIASEAYMLDPNYQKNKGTEQQNSVDLGKANIEYTNLRGDGQREDNRVAVATAPAKIAAAGKANQLTDAQIARQLAEIESDKVRLRQSGRSNDNQTETLRQAAWRDKTEKRFNAMKEILETPRIGSVNSNRYSAEQIQEASDFMARYARGDFSDAPAVVAGGAGISVGKALAQPAEARTDQAAVSKDSVRDAAIERQRSMAGGR